MNEIRPPRRTLQPEPPLFNWFSTLLTIAGVMGGSYVGYRYYQSEFMVETPALAQAAAMTAGSVEQASVAAPSEGVPRTVYVCHDEQGKARQQFKPCSTVPPPPKTQTPRPQAQAQPVLQADEEARLQALASKAHAEEVRSAAAPTAVAQRAAFTESPVCRDFCRRKAGIDERLRAGDSRENVDWYHSQLRYLDKRMQEQDCHACTE